MFLYFIEGCKISLDPSQALSPYIYEIEKVNETAMCFNYATGCVLNSASLPALLSQEGGDDVSGAF